MRYFDSSALVKLVLAERESSVLAEYASAGSAVVSSDLARTEAVRAVVRSDPSRTEDTLALLQRMTMVPLTPEVLDRAGRLAPASLRSLDAIHLACALTIGEDLDAFVAYDERLLEAASALGLPVASPGAG